MRLPWTKILVCVFAGMGLSGILPGTAFSQEKQPSASPRLKSALTRFSGREFQTAKKYVVADQNGRSFVLLRTNNRLIFRYDEPNAEIWSLRPVKSVGGGLLLKTDTGRVLVRFSPLDGVTFYPSFHSSGLAARATGQVLAFAPDTEEVRKANIEPKAFSDAMSRLTNRRVPVLFRNWQPEYYSALHDASSQVRRGFFAALQRPTGVIAVDGLQNVIIRRGEQSDITLNAGTLEIIVAPELDFAGRPSSERIARILLREGARMSGRDIVEFNLWPDAFAEQNTAASTSPVKK